MERMENRYVEWILQQLADNDDNMPMSRTA
jgi:hypothetical protein